jgi:hypothetical protein
MGYSDIGFDWTGTFVFIGKIFYSAMSYQNFEILDVKLQILFSLEGHPHSCSLRIVSMPCSHSTYRGTSVLKIRHFEDIAEDVR